MQIFSTNPGKIKEEVHVPPSKSYANRALIVASLKRQAFTIKNVPQASDVAHLVKCLEAIGLDIERSDDSIRVMNSFPECEKEANIRLFVGEGGTTARFLAVMLLLGRSRYELILGDRLKDRPWQEFLHVARDLGGKCELKGNSLIIQGPVVFPEILEIDCRRTTQFASAFQLLCICRSIRVTPLYLHSSQSYWSMTEKMLEECHRNDKYTVPLDWSSASYPLAFGALNHEIFFPALKPDLYQADSKLFDLLMKFDCLIQTEQGIKVRPTSDDRAIILDVSDCLDLVPTLGYFLAHIEGKHVLSGIENLIYKESNRLHEVMGLVRNFQRDVDHDQHQLTIWGKRERIKSRKTLSFPDDHRLVMAGTLFLLHHGGGEVSPATAVDKSYPGFFNLISSKI